MKAQLIRQLTKPSCLTAMKKAGQLTYEQDTLLLVTADQSHAFAFGETFIFRLGPFKALD